METDSSDEFNYETPDDFEGAGDENAAAGAGEPPDLGPPMLERQVPDVVSGSMSPAEPQGAGNTTGGDVGPAPSTSDHARTLFVFSQLLNMTPEVTILIISHITMFQTNEETRSAKTRDEGGRSTFSSFVCDKDRC